METQHLILLLISLSAVVCILAGLCVLLWRGFQVAGLRAGGEFPHELERDSLIRWNETTTFTAFRQKTLESVKEVFSRKLSSITGAGGRMPASAIAVTDPVDGTAFQEGETIIRCKCGTNYHQHSWQWIGEKNGAKCVNCKRPGLISTYTRPGAGTVSSDRPFASALR
jgi:hypothetical protein